MNIGMVTKALNATLGVLGTTTAVALQNGHMEYWEWFTVIGSAVLAFFGVYLTNNTEQNRIFKAIAATAVAIGGALGTAAIGGFSPEEWIGLAGVALTAFMTWYAPNAPETVNGI